MEHAITPCFPRSTGFPRGESTGILIDRAKNGLLRRVHFEPVCHMSTLVAKVRLEEIDNDGMAI